MRRISPLFGLAALLALPSVSPAAEHRMRISEVMLSDGGDDAIQFIEISDPANEGFPNGGYYLGVYDADGQSLGSVSLADPDGPTILLISTPEADEAFGVTGDAELTVTLPAAGQACFERAPSIRINCTSWGCVNTRLTGGAYDGAAAAPTDGVSVQRIEQDLMVSHTLGEPTPRAANVAGDDAVACASDPDAGPDMPDAGTGGEADGGVGNDAGGGSGEGGDDDDDDDSGCGCGASSAQGADAGLFALAAIVWVCRRRRVRDRGRRT